MTAEQFVKSHYPKAHVQGYTNRDKSRHYICWEARFNPQFRLGVSNKSKANAWVVAKRHIEVMVNKTNLINP